MKRILLVLLLISLCACKVEQTTSQPGCSIDEPCDDEVIDASANLKWEAISFDEAKDYWDDTVILFYSFKDCPYCVEARPVLEAVTEDTDFDVYYVDVDREERVDGQSTYDDTFAHFSDFIEGEKMLVPFVAFIKDGTTVYAHTATVEGHKPSEAKMVEAQIEELRNYYLEGLALMN